jgi:preprotein translocase subunit SecD
LENPESFADLAMENSEDPGSRDNGGAYTGIKKGVFVPEFEDVAFNKLEVGQIYPEILETSFGYHIIKKDAERGEGDDREVDVSHILINKITEEQVLENKRWLETGLTGLNIESVEPLQQGNDVFVFQITFDEEGKNFLAALSRDNLGKRIAIFINGINIGMATLNEEITDGKLIVGGNFTQDAVVNVSQLLNSGTIHSSLSLAQ